MLCSMRVCSIWEKRESDWCWSRCGRDLRGVVAAGSTVRRSLGGGVAADLIRGQAGRRPRQNGGTATAKPSQLQQPAAGLARMRDADEVPTLRNTDGSDGDSETAVLEALPPSLSAGLKRKRSALRGSMAKPSEDARAGSTADGAAIDAEPDKAEAVNRAAAAGEDGAVQHGNGVADAAAAALPAGPERISTPAAAAPAGSTVSKKIRRKRRDDQVAHEDPGVERRPAADHVRVGGSGAAAGGDNGPVAVVDAAAAERGGERGAFSAGATAGAADAASRKKRRKESGGQVLVDERNTIGPATEGQTVQGCQVAGAHGPLEPSDGATGPLAERPKKGKRKDRAVNGARASDEANGGGRIAAPAHGAAVAIHADGPAWRDHAQRNDIRSGRYSEAEKQTIRDAAVTCALKALRDRARLVSSDACASTACESQATKWWCIKLRKSVCNTNSPRDAYARRLAGLPTSMASAPMT